MNPVKQIYVQMRKARSIYDLAKLKYKSKYKPSNLKEELRHEKRFKKINRFDDEVTNEPAIEGLTNQKAQVMFKMLGEFQNNHRLNRKQMTPVEKAEYISKCKEFSLYQNNLWRKKYHEMQKISAQEENVFESTWVLPFYLLDEVLDPEGVYTSKEDDDKVRIDKSNIFERKLQIGKEDDLSRAEIKEINSDLKGIASIGAKPLEIKENSEDIEAFEHSDEYLYYPQLLRIYPDDMHIPLKTLINIEAYDNNKQGAGSVDTGTPSIGDIDKD